MPLFWRSWVVVSALIALLLVVLTVLSVLQFEAILSALIRERLAILAQTTQASFFALVLAVLGAVTALAAVRAGLGASSPGCAPTTIKEFSFPQIWTSPG